MHFTYIFAWFLWSTRASLVRSSLLATHECTRVRVLGSRALIEPKDSYSKVPRTSAGQTVRVPKSSLRTSPYKHPKGVSYGLGERDVLTVARSSVRII